MIARQWKAMCPMQHKEGFIRYLYETGVKDTSQTQGFKGVQIFARDVNGKAEITLVTYWESVEAIAAFAGDKISVAKLYEEDAKYELEPDTTVLHYEVIENSWF